MTKSEANILESIESMGFASLFSKPLIRAGQKLTSQLSYLRWIDAGAPDAPKGLAGEMFPTLTRYNL